MPFLESHTQPICTSTFISRNPVSLAGLSSQSDGKRVSLPFLLDAATPKAVSEFFRVFLCYAIKMAQIEGLRHDSLLPYSFQFTIRCYPTIRSQMNAQQDTSDRTITVWYCSVCYMLRLPLQAITGTEKNTMEKNIHKYGCDWHVCLSSHILRITKGAFQQPPKKSKQYWQNYLQFF